MGTIIGAKALEKLSESFFGCGSWSKRLSAYGKEMRIIDPLTAAGRKILIPAVKRTHIGIGESMGGGFLAIHAED